MSKKKKSKQVKGSKGSKGSNAKAKALVELSEPSEPLNPITPAEPAPAKPPSDAAIKKAEMKKVLSFLDGLLLEFFHDPEGVAYVSYRNPDTTDWRTYPQEHDRGLHCRQRCRGFHFQRQGCNHRITGAKCNDQQSGPRSDVVCQAFWSTSAHRCSAPTQGRRSPLCRIHE